MSSAFMHVTSLARIECFVHLLACNEFFYARMVHLQLHTRLSCTVVIACLHSIYCWHHLMLLGGGFSLRMVQQRRSLLVNIVEKFAILIYMMVCIKYLLLDHITR